MTLEEMKRKYAYTLARVGLNVQKGQTVLVEASVARLCSYFCRGVLQAGRRQRGGPLPGPA